MKTMVVKAFIDTNVVLRLLNNSLPEYPQVNQLIQQVRIDNLELWISRQVIREYLVQVTRPGFFVTPLSMEQSLKQVETLRSL